MRGFLINEQITLGVPKHPNNKSNIEESKKLPKNVTHSQRKRGTNHLHRKIVTRNYFNNWVLVRKPYFAILGLLICLEHTFGMST